MTKDPVRTSIDGPVGTLTLDHPPLNVLTHAVRAAVVDALADFAARGVRALVVTGAGERAFCAGADLNEEQELTAATAPAFRAEIERFFSAFADYPGAVIAAVNGRAYGGGFEMALACDIRIAAGSATFAGVGVALGLVVSTARLSRLCGEAVAAHMLLTGTPVSAADALAWGLVSKVVPDAEAIPEARAVAEMAASRAPLSVRANKVALRHCARLPWAEAVAYERGEWARLQRTRDHKEALDAFFHKRTPQFTGA